MQTIQHWINGTHVRRRPDSGWARSPTRPPARSPRRVAFASTATVDEAVAAAAAAFPAWRDTSLARRIQILFTFRELLNARKGELAAIITAEHGKVLDDALGEVVPRPGGRRVRLRHPAPAQGRLHGERLHQGGCPLDPPAAGPVGGHLPVQLPGHGADVVLPDGHRRRQHGGAQAEREGSDGGQLAGRAVGGGRPAGRRVQRACTATRKPSTRCWTHPEIKSVSFVGSTPIAQYVYERGTAHGKRVQALGGAKNHMLVLPDADLDLAADAAVNAGFGSAGERCMAISAVVAVGAGRRRTGGQDRRTHPQLRVGRRHARHATWARWSPAAHRDKVAGYIDAGEAAGAKLVVDGRNVPPTPRATASGWPRRCSTTSRPR